MSETYTIVVADDEPAMLKLIECLLRPLKQIRVVTASDGSQAIACCREVKPDLILLDHNMPGLDGFSTCQIIRNSCANENCQIWFVTAFGNESDLPMAQEVGANRVIAKPFQLDQMRTWICQALGIDTDDSAAA